MVYSRCVASDYPSVIASSLIKWFIYKSKKKKKYKRTPVNCEEMTKEKLKDMFG